jgi:uncharacterized membrane protein YozB (DUF420 family)
MSNPSAASTPSEARKRVEDAAITFMVVFCMCLYFFVYMTQTGAFASGGIVPVIYAVVLSIATAVSFASFVTKSINLIRVLVEREVPVSDIPPEGA